MNDASTSVLDTQETMSRRSIIRWWEARRLGYNIWVGSIGIVAWILVEVAGSAAVKPGVDFEEPIVMIVGPLIYVLFANLFYTLGWIIDTSAYTRKPRKSLYNAGLLFSILLTALPGAWAVTAWLITLHTGNKFN